MKPRVTFLSLSAIVLLMTVGHAQAATNFSGDWKLNTAKSDYGPIPAPDVMTRKISHNDPSIQIKTYQKGEQGEVSSELNYTTDGKPAVNKVPGGEAKGSAKWDGNSL